MLLLKMHTRELQAMMGNPKGSGYRRGHGSVGATQVLRPKGVTGGHMLETETVGAVRVG